jgi:hypothetical protein
VCCEAEAWRVRSGCGRVVEGRAEERRDVLLMWPLWDKRWVACEVGNRVRTNKDYPFSITE